MQETMMSVPFGTVTIEVEHYKALIERVAQLEHEVESNVDKLTDIAWAVKQEDAYYKKHHYGSGELMKKLAILTGVELEDGDQE